MGLIVAHPIANSEFGHFKKWLKGRAPRGERSEPRGTQRFCEGLLKRGVCFCWQKEGWDLSEGGYLFSAGLRFHKTARAGG